jgi:DNA-binding LacI/PurR family transcriptional regulator
MVAQAILSDIRKHQLASGDRIWGVRELAERHGTSMATTQCAMQLLQDCGIVDCRPRQGAYLCEPQHGRIGIIVAPEADSWSRRIIEAAVNRLHLTGRQTTVNIPLLEADNERCDAVAAQLDQLRNELDGIIFRYDPRLAQLADERDITWAAIHPANRTGMANMVDADDYGGFERLGRCLAETGRTRVVVLAEEPQHDAATMQRITGLHAGLIGSGASIRDVDLIALPRDGRAEAHGFDRVNQLLRDGLAPQAIVGMDDYAAIGAMRACGEYGLVVGDDVAVIGGNGSDAACYTTPKLTVVEQPTKRMGWHLGGMMLQMLNDRVRRVPCVRAAVPMLFRDSFRVGMELQLEIENTAGLGGQSVQPRPQDTTTHSASLAANKGADPL